MAEQHRNLRGHRKAQHEPEIQAPLAQWIRTASRNAAIDSLRAYRRKILREGMALEKEGLPVGLIFDRNEQHLVARDLLQHLRPLFEKALWDLSDSQRTVLEMHLFEDMPFKEVLDALRAQADGDAKQLTIEKVRARYRDGLRSFRKGVVRYMSRELSLNSFARRNEEEVQRLIGRLRAVLGDT